MIHKIQLSSLTNPLATIEQLSTSSSQLDGIPADLEASIRYAGAQLTQAAGILLRLPQDLIAQAVVTFTRFYVGPEGGSFRLHSAKVCVLCLQRDIITFIMRSGVLILVLEYLGSLTLSHGQGLLPAAVSPFCTECLCLSSLFELSVVLTRVQIGRTRSRIVLSL